MIALAFAVEGAARVEHAAVDADDLPGFLQVGQIPPERGRGDIDGRLKLRKAKASVFPDKVADGLLPFMREHAGHLSSKSAD